MEALAFLFPIAEKETTRVYTATLRVGMSRGELSPSRRFSAGTVEIV
jgi:hypothetical protein